MSEWLNEDDFQGVVFVDQGYVHCEACIRGLIKSDFVKGIPTDRPWNRSQLSQHCKGQKHSKVVEDFKENTAAARQIRSSRVAALAALHSSIIVIITLVYWLCCENVAMLKLGSLYCMVKSLSIAANSFKSTPNNYVNAARCREFVMALSEALHGKLWDDIRRSPFISVFIDESTDISTSDMSENMIIYVIYLKNGRAVVSYVSLRHAPAVDAESIQADLMAFFAENDLDIRKFLFFCSDGAGRAAVMTGRHNGVGARLQSENPFITCIHCIVHQLALCCADSAEDVDYPAMAETVVNHISSYFNRSGKRIGDLQAVAKEFDLSRTKIVKSGKTRWLSCSPALHSEDGIDNIF